MTRWALVVGYLLSFLIFLVFASAALEGTSLASSAIAFSRAPEMVFSPGLEGQTASQLLAIYDAAALVAILRCAAEYFQKGSRYDESGRGKAVTAIVFCRGSLIALVAFAMGVAGLAAAGLWMSSGISHTGISIEVVLSMFLIAVAITLGIRFWRLAGDLAEQCRAISSSAVAITVLKVDLFLLTFGLVFTVVASFIAIAVDVLPYILFVGVPTLLVSYVFIEGTIFKVRRGYERTP